MIRVSVCITILNEERTLNSLLDALAAQTVPPSEVIITDGGSTDGTMQILHEKASLRSSVPNVLIPLVILEKNGNRSVGRNVAISKAKNDWIAITDAGCIPHSDWLEELINQQQRSMSLVVAGYYDAVTSSPLQEAMVPYVLVMPDRADQNTFLPATRSMLLNKKIWSEAGRFDEQLSDNEDYAFAKKIAELTPISFAKAAKVSWIPRETLGEFYRMLYRFARGDIQAGILRSKVVLIFLRYLLGSAIFLTLLLTDQSADLVIFISVVLVAYSNWAIYKNFRYAPNSWYWLPVLQYIADAAVMSGSLRGIGNKLYRNSRE